MPHTLEDIYQKLLSHFGPQHWWPGDTPFEICVGAILTQNTAWSNVEKAIANLKNNQLLSFERLLATPAQSVAELIKPAGYFNIKTKRLKSFLGAIKREQGDFDTLSSLSTSSLREFLLSISGIGPETADSMMLYAFERPVFVVDAYTNRMLTRHSLVDEEADYFRLQEYFEDHLEKDVALFNEYHALIVKLGKEFCRKSNPKCEECPLREEQ
ncbi:MAG: Helix-hairpin-helix motif:HhH-GPD [uncultured bacterium]|nr:MAG: Helix-hairpin-helix motif:HhH-GPD [uncultured bacterium]